MLTLIKIYKVITLSTASCGCVTWSLNFDCFRANGLQAFSTSYESNLYACNFKRYNQVSTERMTKCRNNWNSSFCNYRTSTGQLIRKNVCE